MTKDRLRLRVAALTTGAKAALLDDPVDVDLAKLRAGVEEIGQTGFDQSRLEKFGKAIGESALPARVRDELEKFAGHHLTMVHDREASLIPWETMRLATWVPALDAGLSRRYLANDVAVARWSEQRQSAPELRVLVVANPTGDLPGAEKEGRRVAQIASSNSWITVESLEGKKATAEAVLAALSSERYDVIHYAGHAFFAKDSPGQSGVVCSDRTLAATELLNLRKLPALMFFNACESARTRRQETPRAGAGKRLADSVGFAESLMRAGVANYVGTYWPVGDDAADEFSRTFYEALLAGESLGGSLLQSRRRVFALKSIDWADYVHYGDPDFRLKLAGKQSTLSLRRGLGPRWFAERLHGNALVTHFQDLQFLRATRRVKIHAVTGAGLHQRAPQRRDPADVVAVEIDLVGADDAHHPLRASGIGIAHGRPEEDPRRRPPGPGRLGVDHFRGIDSLRQIVNPLVDLAQPPLAGTDSRRSRCDRRCSPPRRRPSSRPAAP